MAGRKPIPTKVKVLLGNPGKRPLNEAEPQYRSGAGDPPRMLDATGKAEWRRVARLMTDAGVLTQADRGVLTLYCSAWSQWVKAKKELRRKGKGEVLEAAKGGYYQNPWLAIANRAGETVAKLGALLGLDPSSRSRLTAAVPSRTETKEKPKVRPQTHLDRLGRPGAP